MLPTVETIHNMAACEQPWCSGTFGHWFWHPLNGRRVLWSDACLGLVRFSARLQHQIPDLLERAATRYPSRGWWEVDRGLIRRGILDEEEAVNPHLHFPRMRHLRLPDPDHNDGLWDKDRYVADLAERAHLRPDQPVEDLGPRIGHRW